MSTPCSTKLTTQLHVIVYKLFQKNSVLIYLSDFKCYISLQFLQNIGLKGYTVFITGSKNRLFDCLGQVRFLTNKLLDFNLTCPMDKSPGKLLVN